MEKTLLQALSKILIIILACLILPFYIYPELDIKLVSLFTDGYHFIYAKNPIVIFVYKIIPLITKIYAFGLISVAVYYAIIKRCPKKASLIISTLIILSLGSGIIVNSILKNNWGRARPAQILEFGGNKDFTSVFIISDQCSTNCSFTSGHAAAGFNFITLSYFFALPLNSIIYVTSFLLGLAVGIVRVMQGGHFPSDVLCSGLIVIFTNYLVHKYLYVKIEKVFAKILTK
jgi:lipid A 4'-phosphatase